MSLHPAGLSHTPIGGVTVQQVGKINMQSLQKSINSRIITNDSKINGVKSNFYVIEI